MQRSWDGSPKIIDLTPWLQSLYIVIFGLMENLSLAGYVCPARPWPGPDAGRLNLVARINLIKLINLIN